MNEHALTLSNGVTMPALGFGTYKIPDGHAVERAIWAALSAGYRCIDTASFYGNEGGIGKALRAGAVPREELFITTKVWNSEQGFEATLRAFSESMKKLGTGYLDLYLIHWPVRDMYAETWTALERLYREKSIRAIGVSNFTVDHLDDLIKGCAVPPMVNQVEMHPLLHQRELALYCRRKNIQVQSWAPLSRGLLFDDPVVTGIAERLGKTPAQVLLRWGLDHGYAVIPKSTEPQRIAANAAVFDFSLDAHDMDALNGLNRNRRLGPDPENFDF